ncbi:MAG: hypothetical protein ACLPID_21130 [Beijerinckiaceae bacterium]
METRVVAVRLSLPIYKELERVASIGGMSISEAQKEALENYLRLDDSERLRRFQASALELLAKAYAELRRMNDLVTSAIKHGHTLSDADHTAWRAALNAVEAAATRVAP